MRAIDVLISSPRAAVRDRLRRAVRSAKELRIVGMASGDAECVSLLRSLHPETALLQAGGNGGQDELPIAIASASVFTRVLVCEHHVGDERALRATALGFWGCVDLDDADDVLVRAIHAISRGELWVSRKLLSDAFLGVARRGPPAPSTEMISLTERENELTNWIALGLSNKVIARHLGISPATVKTHVHRILHKLHARSRVQLGSFRASDTAGGGDPKCSVILEETLQQLAFDFV